MILVPPRVSRNTKIIFSSSVELVMEPFAVTATVFSADQ